MLSLKLFKSHNSLKVLTPLTQTRFTLNDCCLYSTNPKVKVEHPFFRHGGDKQTVEPVAGKVVKGQIPKWLEGTLVRNGPGIQKVGSYNYNHMFDGLAILHKYSIKDGKAFYQSRALESDAYKNNFAADRITIGEFGTAAYPDPCQSIFGRLQTRFNSLVTLGKSGGKGSRDVMTDNCCVNVAYYGDQLYAMTETVFIRRIDPETLKSVGDKTRIRDYCVLNTATAHPHCLEDGTIINVGNNFRHKASPHYCFVKVPPSYGSDETVYKNAKFIGEIPSRWKFNPAYFHSFGMTEDKIIFLEMPLCINLPTIATQAFHQKSYIDCMTWYPNEKTRFHILAMEDGKPYPVIYETNDLFTFHHINAYEENGFLIVDVSGYNNADIAQHAKIYNLENPQLFEGASARRYVLPLSVEGAKVGDNLVELENTTATAKLRKGSGTPIVDLTPHHFTKDWLELTMINYKYNGKKYNFFYGLGATGGTHYSFPAANKITKVDIAKGTTIDYIIEGCMASEPIFVADPTIDNPAEDDGVLLSAIIHDSDPRDVSLIILNAKDMTEVSRIDFRAEGAVTGTFHGIWASNNTN